MQFKMGIRPIIAVAVCTWLSGCFSPPRIVELPPASEPVSPPVVMVPAKPERERSRVAILLSDDVASYSIVAKQIAQRISEHDYITLNLGGSATIPEPVLDEITEFEPDKIVAIGLLAARVGRNFSDKPMVFCQVFNYSDHELISPASKGINFLPPFALQLEVWKEINPDLKRIGLIIGPNQEALVAEIEQAAEQHKVQLLARTVRSDKEALYAFKRLTPQIQGFWLLPDNRVLSPGVLREIVTYGRKHGNQTVVFSPQLLAIGADISFASSDADVANAVIQVLGDAADKDTVTGPPMTPLTTLRVEIRPEIADALRTQSSARLAQYRGAD